MSSVENHPNHARSQRLIIVAVAVAAAALMYSAYYFLHSRYFEETDDAYVASDLIQINSEVGGTVASVFVDNTQTVQKGQVLVELDKSDAAIAVASAEAELAKAVRNVRGLFAKSKGLDANLQAKKLALSSAQSDLQRRLQVASEGGVSDEELQHVKDQVAQLQAAVASINQDLDSNNVQIENTTIATHPLVLAAAANLRQAELTLKRTQIVAPVSGVVARKNVDVGSRIAQGTPLMAVVPLENAWVDANFKEVQLEKMRIGQAVELRSDLYGSDVKYTGKIVGIGAGSGAAFSLLPPQNASGNWIKIVQRVPVRIALDLQELQKNPLRVGLSMHAIVDTKSSGAAQTIRAVPQVLAANLDFDERVEKKLADIIKRNSR